MQNANSSDPIPKFTEELEQRLDAARKEKTLAQVPALRRLRMVVRTYFVLGVIIQPVMIAVGVGLHDTYSSIVRLGLGVSSYLAFGLYSAGLWASVALGWLLLCVYFRFLKQLRVNHVQQIQNTTAVILPIFRYQLLLVALGSFVFPIGMFQNREVAVKAGLVAIPIMIWMIVMYLIARRYVLTAEAELPALAASAGDNAPRGNYRSWKFLFVTLLIIALPVFGLGFILGGDTASGLSQVRIQLADLPSCTGPEVAKLLEQLIPNMPDGGTLKSIDGHRELSYDPDANVRHGECVAHTEAGEIQVKFVVEWQNRSMGLFQVRLPQADLPSCTGPVVVNLLEQVIRSTPVGATLKSIEGHRELSYDSDANVRHGECIAHTEAGDIQLKFIVEWQDRNKGLFQVRMVAE